jgi:predicted RNA methylase
MKLRALESLLEGVDAFETPKVALEQYPTSPHIAARIVHTAESFGDIRDRVVVDLGCGGGVLTLGAALCGAGHVVSVTLTHLLHAERLTTRAMRPQVGIDIDADAISLTTSNAAQFEDVFVDVLHAHVTHLPPSLRADTVIMCAFCLRILAKCACLGLKITSRRAGIHHLARV